MDYPTESEKKFHILSLPVDDGGCGWMRVRGPFNKFKKLELAEAEVMVEGQIDEDSFKKLVSKADIIIARPGAARLMKTVKQIFPYKKVVVDMDDDLFNILPSSEHYRLHGKEDVSVTVDGKEIPLWKSGTNGFNRFDNKKRLIDLEWMLNEADAITCVTSRLGEWISNVTGKDVSVIPNAIDFDLFPDIEVKANDKREGEFRIGWCGGGSHSADLQMIKGEMIKLLKNNPDITLHMVGQKFDTFNEAKDQVVFHDWLHFQANPFRLKSLDLDVLLAPLEDTVFNIRKDPLKFWDASGIKVPLLASNIPPFSDVIVDGENGMLFDTPKEMSKKIVQLKKDKKFGVKLATRAREYVKEKHNLERLAPLMIDYYKNIWKQKK